MTQLATAVIAGFFSLFIAILSVYRSAPEKRIVGLQEVLANPRLSTEQEKKVMGAIDRQVSRLDEPDYVTWFLYSAFGGTGILLISAFFVGIFADNVGKLVLYGVYAVYVVISTVIGLSLLSRTIKGLRAGRK